MNTTPLEQLLETATGRRSMSLGVPANTTPHERRFPLTPEGAGMLVARGMEVRIEQGAGQVISYDDARYARAGAQIVTHAEAMAADMVLHLGPVSVPDARRMRRGALLMTFLHPGQQNPDALNVLLERHIISIALDLITDRNGHTPFADIIDEVDGRAAVTLASSMLADPVYGKGILLGGIAGINPCEVTVIGAGIAGIAAARSAVGLGALVRIFDTDVYRLRHAVRMFDPGQIVASAMHPRTVLNALRTADIIVATPLSMTHVFGPEAIQSMKKGVITFSLGNGDACSVFPAMACVDLASESPAHLPGGQRVCFTNAAGAVPRTTAMALSDTLATTITDIIDCGGGMSNTLKLHPGMQRAVYTFLGKPVNNAIARILGRRCVDITLLLQFS